ncbi:MAG: hypothetical protein LBN42_04100 [Oscillospiraceae bacterium]|jgi:virulence-associated protein VapD|nr:hypothetical protein [Oscillospiraceae bacterium]
MARREKHKLITFDISKDKLKQAGQPVVFPDALIPYEQIKTRLEELGFDHIEKSVYKSRDPMSLAELQSVLTVLDRKIPWFVNCVDKMHRADVENEHDFSLLEMAKNTHAVRVLEEQATDSPDKTD